MDGYMDGCMGGWMDAWVHGWIVGLTLNEEAAAATFFFLFDMESGAA